MRPVDRLVSSRLVGCSSMIKPFINRSTQLLRSKGTSMNRNWSFCLSRCRNSEWSSSLARCSSANVQSWLVLVYSLFGLLFSMRFDMSEVLVRFRERNVSAAGRHLQPVISTWTIVRQRRSNQCERTRTRTRSRRHFFSHRNSRLPCLRQWRRCRVKNDFFSLDFAFSASFPFQLALVSNGQHRHFRFPLSAL